MVDDAVDESGGTGGSWEDGGPIGKREIGGEDEAFFLVTHGDDAEEEVCISLVVGEIADFIDAEAREGGIVLKLSVQSTSGILCAQVEQEVCGRDEKCGVAAEDGVMSDIFGDHGFAETLGSDEDDVFSAGEEVQRESSLDRIARDFLGPVPIEIGDGFEFAEFAASGSSFETPTRAVLLFEMGDVLEELTRGEALFRGVGHEVVELFCAQAQTDELEGLGQVRHGISVGSEAASWSYEVRL